jgi:hypothetical protein
MAYIDNPMAFSNPNTNTAVERDDLHEMAANFPICPRKIDVPYEPNRCTKNMTKGSKEQ